ncbi:MAG: class I SAM-dependent RNA methyltransferase [Bdellovibrionales bacterium]|nr:class I SAM-dependent RNA methyltransferase [Bdellovibrionales bacterium]
MNQTTTDLKVGDKITLTIDRLSYDGGRGVGRFNNFVFFVPQTAPNEKIKATITKKKKNYGEARLLEILEASPSRREALCPVVTECGGCAWQHISYSEQLNQKRDFIKHHLKAVLHDRVTLPPISPSVVEYRYRNRVQVHARKNFANEIEFGFFKAGSNSLVPISDCYISEPELFSGLKAALQHENLTQKNGFHKYELAMKGSERVIRDLSKDESEFTQINSAQNQSMIQYVLNEVNRLKPEHISKIYDLYCGSGNITEPMAKTFAPTPVVGVEMTQKAIDRAKLHASPNAEYIAGDVATFLSRQKLQAHTVVTLDPARAGLGSTTISQLLRLKPDLIVYISCSLPSLARDLQSICKNDYAIDSVCGFDMFPQTEYVETVVTLLPRDMKAFCSL